MHRVVNVKEPTNPRRLFILIVCLIVLCLVCWWGGLPANLLNSVAATKLLQLENEAAEWWLNVAESVSPGNTESAYLRARIDRRYGRFESMLRRLEQIKRKGFDSEKIAFEETLARAQAGELETVESELNDWLGDGRHDVGEVSDSYCNGLSAQGRLDDALIILRAWESDLPADPRPNWRRGLILEHRQNFEDAIAQYEIAVKKNPRFGKGWYALGRVLKGQRRTEEAMAAFERCYSLPHPQAAELGVATCLRELGHSEQAKEIYQRLLKSERQELKDSFAAVDFSPDGDPVARELGVMLSTEGDHVQALSLLESALHVWPHDLEARYAYAIALRGAGETERSEAEFESVRAAREALAETPPLLDRIQRDPQDTAARLRLAEVHLKYDAARKGLFWLQSILAYDPANVECHRMLAEHYESHSAENPKYRKLAIQHRSRASIDIANP
jgi:tetratricopeptide (TPR) repeat protein